MIEAPFSELDYSSDYLDEFHGFLEDEEQPLNEEDALIYGAITPNYQEDYQDADGIPINNRAGEPILGIEEEVKESYQEEEKTGGTLPLKPVKH